MTEENVPKTPNKKMISARAQALVNGVRAAKPPARGKNTVAHATVYGTGLPVGRWMVETSEI